MTEIEPGQKHGKHIRDENICDVQYSASEMSSSCHQTELPIAVPAEFPQRVWGLRCGNLPSPASVRPVVDAPQWKHGDNVAYVASGKVMETTPQQCPHWWGHARHELK